MKVLIFPLVSITGFIFPLLVEANLSDLQLSNISKIQLAMGNPKLGAYLPKLPKPNQKKTVKIKKIVKAKTRVKKEPKAAKKKPQKSRKVSYCLGGSYDKLTKKSKKYQKDIAFYSAKYEVSVALVKAIITAESCFNERAESPKGAQGLMQLMPQTAKRFGVTDRFNPSLNIKAGTKYLQFLLKYYDEDLLNAIAAYNAGEGAVDKYKGIPPYNETKLYVSKVAALYKLYSQGGGVLSSASVKLSSNKALIKSIFVPRAMPRSRFSPYKGRGKNIAWGQCANRTSSRLKKTTKVEGGDGIWQRVYIAQRGDTLLRVMQRTGVHKSKIARMNGLRSRSRLKEGQRLLVWECRKK